ncbi:DUF6634 family protein [Paracoccus siganidrum]|uniref:DUF6634 family protein n=1 Tax=Paracoccus siganidrum TaxID=1276757 RepID=UPI0011C4A4C4|nr:DUF6634 family protein [Paracoccus siganidrum]
MHHQHHVLRHVCSVLATLDAGPPRAELATAPILQHWQTFRTLHGSVVLAGCVSGHPVLRDGPICTSGLLSLCPAGGWARTVSRWYRLGTPVSAGTPDETPIIPDNLAMALLIDGLQPLDLVETQSLLTLIRDCLRTACKRIAENS